MSKRLQAKCVDGLLLWYLILWCFYCTNLETRFSTARGKFRVRSWSLVEIKTQCVQVYIIKRIVIHSERVDTSMCSVPSSLGLYPCELHGYNNIQRWLKHAKSESKAQTTSKRNFANTLIRYMQSGGGVLSLLLLLLPLCVLVLMLARYGRAITFFPFDSFESFYRAKHDAFNRRRASGKMKKKRIFRTFSKRFFHSHALSFFLLPSSPV